MRIVIAEDSVLLREGLQKLMAGNGIDVVAAVADADALLRAVEKHQPELALIDVRMPPTHTDEGVRAALVLKQQWPHVAVLMLSQYVEERYAADLLAQHTGGLGYLLKDRVADVGEFIDAVRRVAGGGTALDPEVVAQIIARGRSNPLRRLTPRETDVLATMAEGRSNAAIAEILGIGGHAVEKHVTSIFAKLDLPPADSDHRRVLAVLHFLQNGARP
ncbi:MAG: response regulator transcription factor [Actinoplanes sp.]